MGIPSVILLVLTASGSVKTAKHLSARGFVEIFGATDAALLTQGKDNKAKRSQNICWEAVVVRCPLAFEVNGMDEMELEQEVQEEAYVPRPWWQVWGARIALVIFILGLIMYYCNIYGAFQ